MLILTENIKNMNNVDSGIKYINMNNVDSDRKYKNMNSVDSDII